MRKDRNKTIVIHTILKALMLALICGLALAGSGVPAYADVATDTLTIKVGYGTMQLDEYVEVDTYHWRDLIDQLELHEEAYSYFQSESKTKYNAIVDSAQGFYITDLLDLAGIYYGDVRSLKFYVEDHKGIRTTFDKSALFEPRYYYDDVAGNRTIVYATKTVTEDETEIIHHDAEYETETYIDEETGEEKTREVLVRDAWDEEVTHTVEKEVEDKRRIIEYRFDHAADHATQVQPMLAVEDSWAQFNEEFEHIGPDFSSLNAGNRFRLLFGQTSPTESLTGKSDKYVSCVYVILEGSPAIGDMGKLDGRMGSHTVEMTVSADNKDIRDSLSKLMNIDSTNKDVLVITNITVTPDSKYSDKAKVTVSYDIVGKGEASITAGVGAAAEPLITSETVRGGESSSGGGEEGSEGNKSDEQKQDPGRKDPKKSDNKTSPKDSKKKDGSKSADQNKKKDNKKSAGGGSQSDDAGRESKTVAHNAAGKIPDSQKRKNAAVERPQTNKTEERTDEIDNKDKDQAKESKGTLTYLLSDEAVDKLDSNLTNQTVTPTAEKQEVEQVRIEDKTEEKEKRKRQLLLFTGLGCLFIGAAGSVTELISFKLKLKGVKKQWS